MAATTNWAEAIKPLLKKYKNTKHPLNFNNTYQLLVAVVLAAQTTDKLINTMSPDFFTAFPNMQSLARATPESLLPYLHKVRNFKNKTNWLLAIAQQIKKDKNIPLTIDQLTALPGIGRKSASVIMRESGAKPEGVIVDLHVVRVAPRLGIAKGDDPKKIERQIMEVIPQKDWGVGMAISFLGREICRPTNPNHAECVMKNVCQYHLANKKGK